MVTKHQLFRYLPASIEVFILWLAISIIIKTVKHSNFSVSIIDSLFGKPISATSPEGAISCVEVPDMMNNIPAVLSVMQFIYENIAVCRTKYKIVIIVRNVDIQVRLRL